MPQDQPVVRMPGEGRSHRTAFGDSMIWLAGEADTGERLSVHERTAPPGARSSPHVHHELVEAFYVLDGECEFVIGDRTLRGGAGTFVLAPKATLHGWAVLGDSPAKMLVFFTPSAKRSFFEELHSLVESGFNDQAMRVLAERYHWT